MVSPGARLLFGGFLLAMSFGDTWVQAATVFVFLIATNALVWLHHRPSVVLAVAAALGTVVLGRRFDVELRAQLRAS